MIVDKIRQYLYYILIGILSFLALSFLPLIGGSSGSLGWGFPTTAAAWVVWISSRVACSTLNVLIFHCFIKQGDTNTKNDPTRLEAEDILNAHKGKKEKIPLSPHKFFVRAYGRKVPTVFLFSILSLVAFGPILLVFNITAFLAYLFTIIMALVFGVLEMKRVEAYYTEDMIKYARYVQKMEETNTETHEVSV